MGWEEAANTDPVLNLLRKELIRLGVDQARKEDADIEYVAIQAMRAMAMAYSEIVGMMEQALGERIPGTDALVRYAKGSRDVEQDEHKDRGVVIEDTRAGRGGSGYYAHQARVSMNDAVGQFNRADRRRIQKRNKSR